MSPTIFRIKGYRFYFLSNEELRRHVHIECADGEAKIWVDPVVEVASHNGLSGAQVNELTKLVRRYRDEIIKKWEEHFG